jgi:hypothetical protein
MKKNNLKLLAMLAISTLLFASCYKKFDTASYAPAFTINGVTSVAAIEPASLVGYWAFDGSLIDSVTGKVATNNGTGFTGGFKGQALQGAGGSYAITPVTSTIANLHSFTVSYWVNSPLNANGIVGMVNISNTGGFWGNLDMFFENGGNATTGYYKVHVNNNGVDAWLGNYTLNNPWNTWINFTVTYDGASSVFNVYQNGNKIATSTQAGYGPLVFQNASDIIFGTVQFQTSPSLGTAGGTQGWASYLKGSLDEVRIYNKALNADQVNAMVVLQGKGK